MKILLINPNLTQAVTDRVLLTARAAARPGTALLAVTGRFGAQVVGSRAEDALAAHGVLDLAACHAPGCDAVVLAISLDTALWACREALDIPVVGMTEAGLLTAAMLVPRFGLLTYGRRLIPVYRERVEATGLLGRLAAIGAVEVTPQQTFSEPERVLSAVRDEALRLVDQGAEAVLLAGAAMAAMAAELQPALPVPLLDGITCAVGMAETLAHQRWMKPRVGSVSATGGREVQGVGAELQALLGRR